MGRKANAKWANRSKTYAQANISEKRRLRKLFGKHRKFKAASV